MVHCYYSSLFILISAFLIISLPALGFIGRALYRPSFELLITIIFLLGEVLFWFSAPSSPGFLSFFIFILLIPFPRSLIFAGAPVYGVGGFFSLDSPLEPRRVRVTFSFILPVAIEAPKDPNDACETRLGSTFVGSALAAKLNLLVPPWLPLLPTLGLI